MKGSSSIEPMSPNDLIIEPTDLVAGDILLCVGEGELASSVTERTRSSYTHSAICYSNAEVAHMGSKVETDSIGDFVNGFKYVAVFRGPDFWSERRLLKLRKFVDEKANAGTSYDLRSALSLMKRQEDHQIESLEKMIAHFVDGVPEPEHNKAKYVCSEFVAACLIEVGIWGEGMATAYQPDALHPGNQGHDASFGYLVGFLRADPTTVIPADDEFACSMTNQMTYSEWQNAAAELACRPPETGQKLDLGEIQQLFQINDIQETAEDLLVYCGTLNRLVPMPSQWNELYGMLKNTRQKPSGGWVPPLPLILGAWHHSMPIEKQLRFREHLEWAQQQGQIGEVGAYLRSLTEEQWCHFGEV